MVHIFVPNYLKSGNMFSINLVPSGVPRICIVCTRETRATRSDIANPAKNPAIVVGIVE